MTAPRVLAGEAEVRAAVGSDLGTTDWIEVTGERLAQFAAATGDTDGAYFAISLSNMFLPRIVEIRGFAIGINYGTDTVRFGLPLTAGDRVRGTARLVDVADVKGGIQTRMVVAVEVDGGKPGCVIEALSRWLV